jgi:hypothetical protein
VRLLLGLLRWSDAPWRCAAGGAVSGRRSAVRGLRSELVVSSNKSAIRIFRQPVDDVVMLGRHDETLRLVGVAGDPGVDLGPGSFQPRADLIGLGKLGSRDQTCADEKLAVDR